MRPIDHTLHPTMFHRIPMDVFDVAREVILIADCMLVKATLLYATLTASQATRGTTLGLFDDTRKPRFDQRPPH